MDGSIKETLDFMVLGYRGSLEELDQEEISPDELAMWISVRGADTQNPIV